MNDTPRRRNATTFDSQRALQAAKARWGPARRARLDDLTADEREVVLGLIRNAARRKATASEPDKAA
jgi:hypothetical protein